MVGVTYRVVCGTQLAIEPVLTACGWWINTAFVERLTLDIRQRGAAVGRRVHTLCKGADGLLDQLALFQTYHHFVLPHASIRQPWLIPGRHQWQWLSQGVAVADTGDGGGA